MRGLAAIVIGAFILVGCSGDDGESAEGWASSVCGSLSTWLTEVDEALESLADDGLAVNEEDVQTAVDQAEEATTTLVEELDELGPPETEGGEETQRALEGLVEELRSEVETVQEAVDSESGTDEVASTVSGSISEAFEEISSLSAELRKTDPAGELQEGFDSADECDSFRERLVEIGS